MRFECAGRTHVGLKRKINEDSILAETGRGLWAVADGMGGHEAGEVASAMVVDALRGLPDAAGAEALAHAAVVAVRRVNADLIDLALSSGRRQTIGTTVVGLVAGEAEYRCFWAGDSRAYRLRGGAIERLSRDHSLVQELVDAGMLAPDEADGHENANLITRAVGVAETLNVDVARGEIVQGDLFLLASDGLTRCVPDDELAADLAGDSLDALADALVAKVLARGAPDNVSVILVRAA